MPHPTETPSSKRVGKNTISGVCRFPDGSALRRIQEYWNERIHDLEMTDAPVGSKAFFQDLDAYRFDKLRYLPRVVDFEAYSGERLLEIGCGIGTDLMRFAAGGAKCVGVDLSRTAVELAAKNAAHCELQVELYEDNGEALGFDDASFDVVYAHGVLQYTADPAAMVRECRRVLKPGGLAIFMVYNRWSWLNALSKLMHVSLEHEDAPVLEKYTIAELRRLLSPFEQVRIMPERFPVRSRLHKGWKGLLFNELFVGTFNLLPRSMVRPLGWHLMAFCRHSVDSASSG